ncbi:MAG: plasmid pRiA4b ORF-3 family protein [Zoogloeaceae bacterium]|jgi:hypothetical protein|nr:plasmid pRiA4b ORF-3 family protein [Zoogloeaceae bacterium]
MSTASGKQSSKPSAPTGIQGPCRIALSIRLLNTDPPVFRRVWLDGRLNFESLHHIVQAAMGWHDAHLHRFELGERMIGVADPKEEGFYDQPVEDERRLFLNRLVSVGTKIRYVYDFGDNWEHELTVEAIEPGEMEGAAWIESGDRACPPEDVGGPAGFVDFLDQLETEPDSERTKELRAWAGLEYNPAYFDRFSANAAVASLFWNRWIKTRR